MGHRSGTRLAIAFATLAILAAMGPSADAAAPAVTDCTVHLRLTRQYTVAELRSALATMPADVKEYTSCSDVIQRALDDELSGLHVSGSGGSGGGSFLPAPFIVLLVVLLLGGATWGALALRRRDAVDDGAPASDGEPGPTRAQDPPV